MLHVNFELTFCSHFVLKDLHTREAGKPPVVPGTPVVSVPKTALNAERWESLLNNARHYVPNTMIKFARDERAGHFFT